MLLKPSFLKKKKQQYHRFNLLQLPDDIVVSVLTYCWPYQLLRMAQVCHFMNTVILDVKSPTTNHLWKQMCLYYLYRLSSIGASSDNRQEKLKDEPESSKEQLRSNIELDLQLEGVDNWLDQYKSLSTFVWCPSRSFLSQKLEFSNHNRTVERSHRSGFHWAGTTAKATRRLTAGHSYRWEIELNQFQLFTLQNFNLSIVGVLPFGAQSHIDILGLIIGHGRAIYHSEHVFPEDSNLTIEQGDVIAIVFDMTQSTKSNDRTLEKLFCKGLISQSHRAGARMEFYLLRNEERTLFLVINNIRGQEFYPAVSMYPDTTITIRPSSRVI